MPFPKDSQYWAVSADGGYLANARLSRQLRHALVPVMRFRQFVDVKPAWGKSKGDTYYWNIISTISTVGGTLIETDVMPEHKFQLARGTLTLSEYGNSIPFTGKLEALSEWDVTNPIARVLRDDANRVLDKAAGLQFKLSQRKYVPLTATTGTFESRAAGNTMGSNAGAVRINACHIKDCVDQLKKWNIPPYDSDGNYICIASVQAMRGIKDHDDFTDAAKYGDPERLFSGEVGRFYGCRFVEETNYLIDTLGSDVEMGEAVVFGAEPCAEGVAVPLELRAKVPTDYGRSKGIAWYALLGFKKIYKADTAGQNEHVIHISSNE